jgi:seryl-tRNA synthetase
MIDLHDLRSRPEVYEKACKDKNIKLDIRAFLVLDEEYRSLKSELEKLRAEQNAFNKELPKLTGEAKEAKLLAMKELSGLVKQKGALFSEKEEQWKQIGYRLPGVPLERVPVGKDDSENVEIRKVGEIRKFEFNSKSHIELGSELDILDIERGVKVAGARNYFLKGDGARLQRAVLSLALDILHSKNYTIMDPPIIVQHQAMLGTGYFPGGEEQAYHLDHRDDGFHLIGTAEVPVCAYHTDEIFSIDQLPKRYAGISPCFRREAGTYGKDAQGVYRVHQFYKVEQVVMCENSVEESARMHAELLANAEELMQKLELPYRVVDVCTGDMGQGQVYKNDIETWMPSRNGYGETHSCSTFYEFQARRLGIRYKTKEGKNIYCHTLNNTLVASPRILIPILELYQNHDGSVTVPKALRPYMGGQELICKPE